MRAEKMFIVLLLFHWNNNTIILALWIPYYEAYAILLFIHLSKVANADFAATNISFAAVSF